MKRFAFYVSNNGTRLKKFLTLYENHKIVNQIEFVLIDNIHNTELKYLCNKLKINYYEVNLSQKIKKNIIISNQFLEYLNKHHVNFAFVFADKILVGDLLTEYKNKLINFHPSILPSHKGLNAIDQALQNNTFLIGNTAHFITEELDAGKVIMQNIFPSIKFKTYNEVLDKQLVMIRQLMKWFDEERIKVDNQFVEILDANYNVSEYIPNLEIV